ncbi:hypothetical protein WKT22_02457 [Candidatus Lokiarchaeum ossiferum]
MISKDNCAQAYFFSYFEHNILPLIFLLKKGFIQKIVFILLNMIFIELTPVQFWAKNNILANIENQFSKIMNRLYWTNFEMIWEKISIFTIISSL